MVNGKIKPAVTANLVGTNSPEKHKNAKVCGRGRCCSGLRSSASGHATKFLLCDHALLACYNVVTTLTMVHERQIYTSSRFSCIRLN